MKRIGIVVAMTEELTSYIGALGSIDWEIKVGCYPIFGINADGKELIVVNSGVGEIAAAAATQMLISEYKVELVINYGYAGALDRGLKCGDIVAVTGVLHYEYDISPIDADLKPYTYREVGSAVIPSYCAAFQGLDERLARGVCASGNLLITREKTRKRLYAAGCSLCEMEAAGVLLTARRAGIPCIVLKVISDNADENAVQDFDSSIACANKEFGKILAEIVKSL